MRRLSYVRFGRTRGFLLGPATLGRKNYDSVHENRVAANVPRFRHNRAPAVPQCNALFPHALV